MLRKVSDLRGIPIHALDGDAGETGDFLFDDERWTIRYLVVDTGGWLDDRLVLLSPMVLQSTDWERRAVHVGVTKEQIAQSPPIATDEPVSRHKEREHLNYYGYPTYWGGAGLWGAGLYPGYMAPVAPVIPAAVAGAGAEPDSPVEEQGDPHLRSTSEVTGYAIQAHDGQIGHVEDFLVDDESWAIRYMVVDTRDWLPGKRVLVAPPWIVEVSWTAALVYVDLPREMIQNAPEYDPHAPLDRKFEAQLHQHYRRNPYWSEAK